MCGCQVPGVAMRCNERWMRATRFAFARETGAGADADCDATRTTLSPSSLSPIPTIADAAAAACRVTRGGACALMSPTETQIPAVPELQVERWFNTDAPITLASLRGQVVLLHAFQMLCPACVQLATPQAQQVHQRFASAGLKVIGLHTVFEHHDAMQPVSLEAYIYENRLSFPIGVDQPDGRAGIPLTMRAWALEGTPSLILIDRRGRMRQRHFGHLPDLVLGVAIGTLLAEDRPDAAA